MASKERLTTQDPDTVIACPECDEAGSVFRRRTSEGYGCMKCGAAFTEYVEREPQISGPKPFGSDLTPEDLGL